MVFLKEACAVLLGGAFGSFLRFIMSRFINEILPKNYPWGIWCVNILGCLVMGVIAGLFMHKHINSTILRAGLMIGILGGFTTFSSFSLDTLTLFQNGMLAEGFTYVFSSVLLSLAATYVGYMFVSMMS